MKSISNEANVKDWVAGETDDNAGAGRYGSRYTEAKNFETEIAKNQEALDEATFIREKELSEFNVDKQGKRKSLATTLTSCWRACSCTSVQGSSFKSLVHSSTNCS